MKLADYVRVLTFAGIDIQPQISPLDGWRWRMSEGAWQEPYATEAHACATALQTLEQSLLDTFAWERLAPDPLMAITAYPNMLSREQQADYAAAWTRLFPLGPAAGWYWHVHDHDLVLVFQQQGLWVAAHVRTQEATPSPYNLLVPGLYEQLTRLDNTVMGGVTGLS